MHAPETIFGRAGLLFGRMFEDVSLEADLFPPASRVFCIASAGCTAMTLAAGGHEVVAVDVNPAQVALMRARLSGGEPRVGSVDRMFARARRVMWLAGWSRARIDAFVALDDVETQRQQWRAHFDTWRFRTMLRCLLAPLALNRFYAAALVRALPRGLAALVRRRLDRGFATHPNRTNPYVRDLLLGERPPVPSPPYGGSVSAVEADAAEYLERCPPGAFGAFTLSNIGDSAGEPYMRRLRAAVARAASRGAVIVSRSFSEPVSIDEEQWARRDRAMIWGRVRVERQT